MNKQIDPKRFQVSFRRMVNDNKLDSCLTRNVFFRLRDLLLVCVIVAMGIIASTETFAAKKGGDNGDSGGKGKNCKDRLQQVADPFSGELQNRMMRVPPANEDIFNIPPRAIKIPDDVAAGKDINYPTISGDGKTVIFLSGQPTLTVLSIEGNNFSSKRGVIYPSQPGTVFHNPQFLRGTSVLRVFEYKGSSSELVGLRFISFDANGEVQGDINFLEALKKINGNISFLSWIIPFSDRFYYVHAYGNPNGNTRALTGMEMIVEVNSNNPTESPRVLKQSITNLKKSEGWFGGALYLAGAAVKTSTLRENGLEVLLYIGSRPGETEPGNREERVWFDFNSEGEPQKLKISQYLRRKDGLGLAKVRNSSEDIVLISPENPGVPLRVVVEKVGVTTIGMSGGKAKPDWTIHDFWLHVDANSPRIYKTAKGHLFIYLNTSKQLSAVHLIPGNPEPLRVPLGREHFLSSLVFGNELVMLRSDSRIGSKYLYFISLPE